MAAPKSLNIDISKTGILAIKLLIVLAGIGLLTAILKIIFSHRLNSDYYSKKLEGSKPCGCAQRRQQQIEKIPPVEIIEEKFEVPNPKERSMPKRGRPKGSKGK